MADSEGGVISAMCWVPRGYAANEPVQVQLSEEEIARMKAEAGLKEANDGSGDAGPAPSECPPGMDPALWAKLDMANYDEEEDQGERMVSAGLGGAMYHRNEDDPYITLPDDDASSIDDFTIKDTDALILTTKTEEDVNRLEVHVYEEDSDNMFFHHDIILETLPLCLAWTGHTPGNASKKGNFVAVGSFLPQIDIYDVDVVDVLEPHCVLGGPSGKKKKSKRSQQKLKADSHQEAVLSVDWNPEYGNVLASGSADATVKAWDVDTGACLYTFDHHRDKVSAVAWNPSEANILLTGSYDGTLSIVDVRERRAAASAQLDSDLEVVCWNPTSPLQFLASTESGTVTLHDARVTLASGGRALFTLSAHDKAASALAVNPAIPNMMVTGSHDKTLKVWDISENRPSLVYTHEGVKVGKIFAAKFFPDSPFIVSVGGSKGNIAVWDTTQSPRIREAFGARAQQAGARFPSIHHAEVTTNALDDGGGFGTSSDDDEGF